MENKNEYLKINLKIENQFKTVRIYHYLINDILKIYQGKNIINLEDIEKEDKKFIIQYIQNLYDKNGSLIVFKNLNFSLNELIYKDIIFNYRFKNKEQKTLNLVNNDNQ